MNLKILVLCLVLVCTSSAEILWGGDPLSVIYPEPVDDDVIVESQQNYIDNQRYLKEFEKRRLQRVLGSEQGRSVVVVTGKYFGRPNYSDKRHGNYLAPDHFFGFEYQSGNTVFRYYNGYQPNCCIPIYSVRPPPRRLGTVVPSSPKQMSVKQR